MYDHGQNLDSHGPTKMGRSVGPSKKGSERFFIVLKYLLFAWKNIKVELKEIIKPLDEIISGLPVIVCNAKPS